LLLRVRVSSDCQISFGEVQPQKCVALSELQTLLEFRHGLLRITPDNLRRLQIKQAEDHISAAVLVTLILL
jgi:hypothetical protein